MKQFLNILEVSEEKRLDPKEIEDVIEIYNKLPYIQIARNYFVSMLLRCPPQVTFKTLKLADPRELELILEIKYLPWLIAQYNWLKMFGVFPWYLESMPGTDHKVPTVPPVDSGYITTYLDKKHRQQFKWYWTIGSADEYERKMYFIYDEGHLPGLNGKLRSSIASLLSEYRSVKIMRELSEQTWYQQAHPQHIFEFHPPRNVPADDNLMNLESFGEKIAGTVVGQQESIRNLKYTIRKNDLEDSLARTYYKNKGMKRRFGPFMKSDTEKQQWELENASIVEKGIPLNADYSYKHVPAPTMNADFVRITNRLDMLSSSVMDIPLNNIESGGARTTISVESSLRFVNERIKGWISVFVRNTKKALLLAYGEQILEAFGDRYRKSYTAHNYLDKKSLEIYTDEEIEVIMPCSPIANKQDYYMLWKSGMMAQKTTAQYLFNDIGIPPEDITISQPLEIKEKEQKKQKTSIL
jgi:hypothetical protein